MRVFVVNLERAKERRDFMARQLERLGLEYEFLKGVDFRDLSDHDILSAMGRPRASLSPHVLGAFAASLTHRLAYARIVQLGLKQALILEDDVILPSGIADILRLIEEMRGHCEVALLAYYSHNRLPLEVSRSSALGKAGSKYLLRPPVSVDQIASAAAYVVSHSVAARMLAIHPVDFVPDHWSKFHRVGAFEKLYLCYPPAVRDAPFPSLVEYPSAHSWISKAKAAARRHRFFNGIAWNLGLAKQWLPGRARLSRLSPDGRPYWSELSEHHQS